MIDFSTLKNLSIDGIALKTLGVRPYTNALPTTTDTDGSIYNGCGYMNGYRLNSNGNIVELAGSVVTGCIPVKVGDIIRVKGCEWTSSNSFSCYISCFSSSHVHQDGYNSGGYGNYNELSDIAVTVDGDITTFELKSLMTTVAYVRISMKGSGENMSLTVNQPIDDLLLWTKPTAFKNWVLYSINADGTIYNGCGYKEGYRVRSGGVEVEMGNGVCTGFIPFNKGDVLRIYPQFSGQNSNNAINFADASFANLGQITDYGSSYGICQGKQSIYDSVVDGGVSTLTYSDGFDGNVAFVRITHAFSFDDTDYHVKDGSEMIVTVNEEIEV